MASIRADRNATFLPRARNSKPIVLSVVTISDAELQNSYVDESEVRGMKRTVWGAAAESKNSRSNELESDRLPSTANDWFVRLHRAIKNRTMYSSMA
jgi:hypothetical protein